MVSLWAILWTAVLEWWAYRKFRKLSHAERKASGIPQRSVERLIELGPTFIKLGQVLSTRPDLIPPEYILALVRLQENVPQFPFAEARQIIERETSHAIEQIFYSLEPEPLAAASLSQVHAGVLINGEAVAVKIRRPGIKERMKHEMELIRKLLNFVKRLSPDRMRRANVMGAFDEFERYTLRELDFLREAETIERFQRNFRDWENVILPRVYWDISSERVLVMEHMHGLKLRDAAATFNEEEKRALITRIIEMSMKMFLTDGFFHADLHPGNVLFTPEGKIILVDLGMVGELTQEQRDHFMLYWLAVAQKQVRRAFYHFKRQCVELPDADEAGFYRRFLEVAATFHNATLQETSVAEAYLQMIAMGYRYGFVFPSSLLLQAKAITTAEALSFELQPNLNFEEVTKPIVAREFARRVLDVKSIAMKFEQTLPELMLFAELLPSTARDKRDETQLIGGVGLVWQGIAEVFLEKAQTYKGDGLREKLLQPLLRYAFDGTLEGEELDKFSPLVLEEFDRIDLPKGRSPGATASLHLAALTIAIYRGCERMALPAERSLELTQASGWKLYQKLVEAMEYYTSLRSDSPDPLKRNAESFRTILFSEPGFVWSVPSETAEGAVESYNCERCMVSDLFKNEGLANICYQTWCTWEYRLAERWGGRLVRPHSIAGGGEFCDFSWSRNAGISSQI